MRNLTQKQENFAKLYVELGNASEAYRRAYDTQASYASVNVKACNLLKQDNVSVRVKELQEESAKRHKITVDSLLDELEEARKAALTSETAQSSAAVTATMSKAKLLGMDKQIIDHQSSDGS